MLGVELERKKKEKREDYETGKKHEENKEEKKVEETKTEENIKKETEQFIFKPKLDLSNIERWTEVEDTAGKEEETEPDDQDFYDAFDSLFD